MEGLVCKKGFLPITKESLLIQKESVVEEKGRSIAPGLKEKLAVDFSRGITLGFFNSSNRVQVLVRSFC